MSPRTPRSNDSNDTDTTTTLPRRRVLAIGAGVGATLLAGCAGDTGSVTESEPDTGEFRLLISDQPADIGDFDSLAVTFSDARIFPADAVETETPEATTAGNETSTTQATTAKNTTTSQSTTDADETTDADAATTEAPEETTEGTEIEEDEEKTEAEEDGDEDDGFYMLDLDGKTVDLTDVIGADAVPVFEGELEAGRYAKIELNVADIAGVVDGEDVEVKVPSETLQITKPFEVTAEEPVDFVFDINVVKRGPKNGYILTPVISESGVGGRDVDYEEVTTTTTA